MTLQASGAISMAQIQAEFGGPTPIVLSNYYRGGAYVPNTPPNAAIPTSGAISLSQFYGTGQQCAGSIVAASGGYGIGYYSGAQGSISYTKSNTVYGKTLQGIYCSGVYLYVGFTTVTTKTLFTSLTINGATYQTVYANFLSSNTFQWTAPAFVAGTTYPFSFT